MCKFAMIMHSQGKYQTELLNENKANLEDGVMSMLLSSIAWAQNCQPSGKYTDAAGETNNCRRHYLGVGSAPWHRAQPIHPQQRTSQQPWRVISLTNKSTFGFYPLVMRATEGYLARQETKSKVRRNPVNTLQCERRSYQWEQLWQMPMFSPNGDGINIPCKAWYKSIVEV